MNPYFTSGFILTLLTFLTGLMIYSNRAGRNSARVRSSQKDAATARGETRTARTMLAARTNGLRNIDQLLHVLKRGSF